MRQTTPKKITRQIRKWSADISTGQLGYFPVIPKYHAGFCHLNCAYEVEQFGGTIVNGWLIWQNNIILEAEPHSIYCKDGKYYDPTKPFDNEEKILFLPDKSISIELFGGFVGTYKNIKFPSTRKERIKIHFLNAELKGRITDRLVIDEHKETWEALKDCLFET